MTLFSKATELEKHLHRDRWLMVTALLADIASHEREEAMTLIEKHSGRVTPYQLKHARSIIREGQFDTLRRTA